MRHRLSFFLIIFLPILFPACHNSTKQCDTIEEWKVQPYRIVKSRCPDLVKAFHYEYDVYLGDIRKGSALLKDTCTFKWQADNESFLTINVCDHSIQELKPKKTGLDVNAIDFVTILSNKYGQSRLLTTDQINTFAKDWNGSKVRNYSDEPFDSAFFGYPAYQYRLTVFSNGTARTFYGYNYLVLDSSNWEYEIGNSGTLKYFDTYWTK